ncbi:MAG: AI-2E family transporter [Gemmatimonadetes bacterium]|nr:AI-2E family transporter [Gemmatimonadota bacterium]
MNRRAPAILAAAIFALLLLALFYSIAEILLLLFIAVLFSLYLSAITDALQRWLSLPRALGLVSAVVLTAVGATGVGYLIVPPVVEQTQELIQILPGLLGRWDAQLVALARRSPMVAQILGPLQQGETYLGGVLQSIGGAVRGLVPYVFSTAHVLIQIISVLVMGIYFALRPALYREGLIALAPPVHRDLVRDLLAELGATLRAWIVGQLLAMVSLGLLTWIGLELLGVPYALAFGVFTGAVAIVPFFGTLVSTLLPALFVLGSAGIIKALLVVLLGVGVHVVEANLVAPMIMERQVQLPPVLTLLSVLVMGHLLHLIGLLVAVPVLATAMVVTRRIYVQRILEGKGFRRAIRDQPVEVKLPADDGVLVHPAAKEATLPAILEQ